MTDVGKSLFCRVTATNAAGSASADSNTVGPVTAAPAVTPFAFIASAVGTANAGSLNAATTAAINTTGAGLLVIALSQEWATAGTIADSKSNTWIKLTEWFGATGTGGKIILYYCKPTTVGSGHTATVTCAGNFVPSLTLAAFSGGNVSPFDQEVGGGEASGVEASGSVAAITPAVSNALVLAAVSFFQSGGTSVSISSIAPVAPAAGGFTLLPHTDHVVTVNGYGNALAYLIQTTAAAADPTWTFSEALWWSGSLTTFKP